MTKLTVSEQGVIQIIGDWTISSGAVLNSEVQALQLPTLEQIDLDGSQLEKFDTSGALLVSFIIDRLKKSEKQFNIINFKEHFKKLLDLTSSEHEQFGAPGKPKEKVNFFYMVGEMTMAKVDQAISYLGFIGQTSSIFMQTLTLHRKLHWNSVLYAIDEGGYRALPIIALLMFLIGIVLAYQLGMQLQSYSANVFIVNLTGIAVLREFGPLITAIIAAGRTSSAYTAQIGLMKVSEEIDALVVMGMSPINRIALPKLLGILIAMPLLTIWADAFGVIGSMVMSQFKFGINMSDFLQRFDDVTDLSSLWTGMLKAPFFGVIIASVGCFKGFRVSYTSESIGRQTTLSVVQAIFLVIVTDAIFSVLFSWAGV